MSFDQFVHLLFPFCVVKNPSRVTGVFIKFKGFPCLIIEKKNDSTVLSLLVKVYEPLIPYPDEKINCSFSLK